MTVGTVVKLKLPLLGNPVGTLGIGFNDYGDGCQFIFANGNYDGFNKKEQELYLEYIRIEPSLTGYEFSNVIYVSEDYNAGVFDRGFKNEEA